MAKQTVVALSSGEAEYAGCVRGVQEGLYVRNILRFLGFEVRLELITDSTSAIGTCKRLGAGRRPRHVEVEFFFLQNLIRDNDAMSLEDAHWRLAKYAATAAGMEDRGSIAVGMPADVIVYDYLANPKLLDWTKEGAETLYVGKMAGRHSIPQDEIEELLVDRAKKGLQAKRGLNGPPP